MKFLLARLSGDWKAYEELQHGGEFEKLEYQIARMDICHYAFPSNLDLVIQGIEKMQPISESEFEGCGTFNEGIKVHLKKEFENLNKEITIIAASSYLEIDEKIQLWLTMCLAKTIKEAMYFSDTVSSLDYNP